jgi:hypothetical protein
MASRPVEIELGALTQWDEIDDFDWDDTQWVSQLMSIMNYEIL